ncbi:MAG: hypothetical protein ORO03_01150 [Alphaproteobacteria bacterium]|nr:hypothetical protein [Alphaproteobacteria bacterium]
MDEQHAKVIFRRKVFYLPGYDPFPARRYRELYRSESARQAAISGYNIRQEALEKDRGYGWRVLADFGNGRVTSEISVLTWSDIVQGSMGHGILSTYGQLVRTAWLYLRSGALVRLMRLRKGPMIAALYPFVLLLIGLAVALSLGLIAAEGMARLATDAHLPLLARLPARLGLAAIGTFALLWLFRRADRHVFAWYLMHDYAFTAAHGGANAPELEARMADFRQRIGATLEGEWDEVLVVGHSSGAHLAVSILSDLIRQCPPPPQGPALAFLSLGQVVPMVSFLPRAERLRADLTYLSERTELTWIDITAPGDGCAFALCDPVSVSGMAGPGKRWPLVLSAAFTQTLSPARWKELRWRFFRLHFQYLCAFDRPGDYDYFRITAGPQTLGAYYAGRQPSKSRIEKAVNPFGRQK